MLADEEPLPHRKRLAVVLRAGEKEVLRDCIKVVRGHWRNYLLSVESVFAEGFAPLPGTGADTSTDAPIA